MMMVYDNAMLEDHNINQIPDSMIHSYSSQSWYDDDIDQCSINNNLQFVMEGPTGNIRLLVNFLLLLHLLLLLLVIYVDHSSISSFYCNVSCCFIFSGRLSSSSIIYIYLYMNSTLKVWWSHLKNRRNKNANQSNGLYVWM